MDKIVYLPLDERPCNYSFPQEIFNNCDIEIVIPPKKVLSNLKIPANNAAVISFLKKECKDAKGLVLSVDMLLYGGLATSRIHNLTREEVNLRADILKEIKSLNPTLKIFIYQLVMRCPCYSTSFEEPDYYGLVGKEIYRYGVLCDLVSRGELSAAQSMTEMTELKTIISEENLNDYMSRRAFNLQSNKDILSLVEDGTVDFLVIPQDDSSQYGFTILDQSKLREDISHKEVESKILFYPGADELGMILMTRMINEIKAYKPRVAVKYASVEGEFVVPLYEDIMLGETVKYQISAAGGVLIANEDAADLILFINVAGGEMLESALQFSEKNSYFRKRNLTVMVEQANYWITQCKSVAIADVAYANGGDIELLKLLKQKNILFKISAVAGWNTSSNSLGTTIAASFAGIYSKTSLKDFLLKRYLEDYGYCSLIRNKLPAEAEKLNENINAISEKTQLSEIVKEKLYEFARQYLGEENITIEYLYFPWRRIFEIGFKARFNRFE